MNKKTQDKLDKLEKIEARNRKRSNSYLKRQKQKGKKQISCLINQKTYDEICKLRDKSETKGEKLTIGQIIDKAILPL